MTLKDILEGYGIDMSTLKFETQKGVECSTVDEIMKSINNATLMFDTDNAMGEEVSDYDRVEISDFDINEDDITLYWD